MSEQATLDAFCDSVEKAFPGSAVEEVGDRKELVIYTGKRVDPETKMVRDLTESEVLDG